MILQVFSNLNDSVILKTQGLKQRVRGEKGLLLPTHQPDSSLPERSLQAGACSELGVLTALQSYS